MAPRPNSLISSNSPIVFASGRAGSREPSPLSFDTTSGGRLSGFGGVVVKAQGNHQVRRQIGIGYLEALDSARRVVVVIEATAAFPPVEEEDLRGVRLIPQQGVQGREGAARETWPLRRGLEEGAIRAGELPEQAVWPGQWGKSPRRLANQFVPLDCPSSRGLTLDVGDIDECRPARTSSRRKTSDEAARIDRPIRP